MIDHPGWTVADDGTTRRVVRKGDAVWSIVHVPGGPVDILPVFGDSKPSEVDVFDPMGLPLTNDLTRALAKSGPVVRVRNDDLWDALATGVVRQVIRAGQARKLYTLLCQEYGEQVGSLFLLPTPDVVLGISDSEFGRLGLSFKRGALRAAAEAVQQRRDEWYELTSHELVTALQSVHRIGPWTAAATVADFTNDFSLYPYADLAVRTWAKRIAPGMSWAETEPEFAARWRKVAPAHLSDITALTLAQGSRS